jgi:hypothetical protein
MTTAERIAARIAQNRAIDARVADRTHPPARSPRRMKLSSQKDDVSFTHSDTFPVIASVITTLCCANNEFVGHLQIVGAMLEDNELGRSLDQIAAKDPDGRPRDWWANSMMKWFSQTFTEGTNPYGDKFERDSQTRPYRYRVRQTGIATSPFEPPEVSN